MPTPKPIDDGFIPAGSPSSPIKSDDGFIPSDGFIPLNAGDPTKGPARRFVESITRPAPMLNRWEKAGQPSPWWAKGGPPATGKENAVTNFLTSPQRGAERMASGVDEFSDAPARGLHDIFMGGAQAAAPFVLPRALINAPLRTIGGLLTGGAVTEATKYGSEAAGLSPDNAQLLGDTTGVLAGGKVMSKLPAPATPRMANFRPSLETETPAWPAGKTVLMRGGDQGPLSESTLGTQVNLRQPKPTNPVQDFWWWGGTAAKGPVSNIQRAFETAAADIKSQDPILSDPQKATAEMAKLYEGQGHERVIAAADRAQANLMATFDQIANPARKLNPVLAPANEFANLIESHLPVEGGVNTKSAFVQDKLNFYRQQKYLDFRTLENEWHQANTWLADYYKKSESGMNIAERRDAADVAYELARRDAANDLIYRYLDQENGGQIPRNLMQRWGAISDFRAITQAKQKDAVMWQPPSVLEKFGSVARSLLGLSPGHSRVGAIHATREIGAESSPDQTLIQAFLNYRGSPRSMELSPEGMLDTIPRDLRNSTTGDPQNLLGPATSRLSTPDTSGPIFNSGMWGNQSGRPAQLPAASSAEAGNVGVSGTTVPDIIGRSSRGKGGPQALLPPPETPQPAARSWGTPLPFRYSPPEELNVAAGTPRQPPLNVLPTGVGSIGPPSPVPLLSTENPRPAPGTLGGSMSDVLRQRQQEATNKILGSQVGRPTATEADVANIMRRNNLNRAQAIELLTRQGKMTPQP